MNPLTKNLRLISYLIVAITFLKCAYMEDNSTNVSAEGARKIIRDKLTLHSLYYISKGRTKDALIVFLIPKHVIKDEKVLYEKSSVQMCGDEIASSLALNSYDSTPVELGLFVCKVKKPSVDMPLVSRKL